MSKIPIPPDNMLRKVAQEIEEILAVEADSGLHEAEIEEIEKGGSEK